MSTIYLKEIGGVVAEQERNTQRGRGGKKENSSRLVDCRVYVDFRFPAGAGVPGSHGLR